MKRKKKQFSQLNDENCAETECHTFNNSTFLLTQNKMKKKTEY